MPRTGRRPHIDTLRISLLGAGRMGRQIVHELAGRPDCALAAVWVRSESGAADLEAAGAGRDVLVSTDLAEVMARADVAIDFTLPAATAAVVAAAGRAGKALVCGVSGIAHADLDALRAAARTIPVFYERNMSVGVAVLRRLVRQAGAMLGTEFAASIHDTHHAQKRDAPSGTALLLGEALAASRGHDFSAVMRYDAAGQAVARNADDIVFHVTREGAHPGRHDVVFASRAERVVLGHEVGDRAVFARGALDAAGWLAGRPRGLYGMDDLLEERLGEA